MLWTSLVLATPTARFNTIGLDRGLPHNSVLAVAQDHQGYIWFGTRGGLSRYDGYRLRNFSAGAAPSSLADNRIRALHVDTAGTLWAGTENGHLQRFDPSVEAFVTVAYDPHPPSTDAVVAITGSYDDHIWIGTSRNGLYRLHPRTGKSIHFTNEPEAQHSLPGNQVRTLLFTDGGLLLAGTDRGTARYDSATESFLPVAFKDWGRAPITLSLHQDRSGRIWIGTQGAGIFEYEPDANVANPVVPSLHDRLVFSLASDEFGSLWAGTYRNGLYRIDADGVVANYRHDRGAAHSLSYDFVSATLVDKTGTLWVGTYAAGVNSLYVPTLALGWHDDSRSGISCLPGSRVFSILADQQWLWLGTRNGLVRYHRQLGNCRVFTSESDPHMALADDAVHALGLDAAGRLWIGTGRGLNVLSASNDTVLRAGGDLAGTAIYHLGQATGGSRMVATGKGLFRGRFEDLDNFQLVPVSDERLHAATYTIATGRNGRIWIGGDAGLSTMASPASTIDWLRSAGRPALDEPVTAVHAVDDTVWAAAGSVLYLLNAQGEELDRFTAADGLPEVGRIAAILSDAQGQLWVSTQRGLLHLDPVTRQLRRYRQSDGLQSDDFMQNAAFRAGNGELFFGGINGFNAFRPSSLRPTPVPPRVVLTRLLLFNQPLLPGDSRGDFRLDRALAATPQLNFSHRDNVFSLEFAALHFADPLRNAYAYRLDGFSENWSHVGADQRLATFTNLDAGLYTFRVKAASPDGVWGPEAVMSIQVLHAPWFSPWAWALYAVLFMLALTGWIRYRLAAARRYSQQLEEEVADRTRTIEQLLDRKNQLFADVSHEFRTPLTLILGPANDLLLATGATDRQRDALALIKSNGLRLLRMVDQLLELARLSAVSQTRPQGHCCLSTRLTFITRCFQSAADSKQLKLSLELVEDAQLAVSADALDKMFSNLVSNAIKYTPTGESVSIRARLIDANAWIEVRNTGIGIPAQHQSQVFQRFQRLDGAAGVGVAGAGLGLALVKELAELHGGTVELSSDGVSETVFGLRLPVAALLDAGQAADSPVERSDFVEVEAELLSDSRSSRSSATDVQDSDRDNDRPSILVIDDNADLCSFIAENLSAEYQVLTAGTGQAGVDLAAEIIPDLVISDVMMPGMDGFEVTRAIKEDERTSHVPVILLTARADRDSRLRGWVESADEYLTKPFDGEELRLRVANLLSIRDMLRARFQQQVVRPEAGGHRPLTGDQQREQRFIDRLNQALEKRYGDADLKISDLPPLLAMSQRQLHRKLKAVIGVTPTEYLRHYRLRKAHDLLLKGEPVGNVALEVGFSSHTYFTRVFRARYGCTPTEHAEQHREAHEWDNAAH